MDNTIDDKKTNAIKRHRKNNQPWGFSKCPNAGENAKTKKVHVIAAAESWHILNSSLDSRTRLGKLYQTRTEELVKSLPSKATIPQLALIEQAVRLSLLADLGWAECLRSGTLRTHVFQESPAFLSYIKVARELRVVYAELFPNTGNAPTFEDMAIMLRESLMVMDAATNSFIKEVDSVID